MVGLLRGKSIFAIEGTKLGENALGETLIKNLSRKLEIKESTKFYLFVSFRVFELS